MIPDRSFPADARKHENMTAKHTQTADDNLLITLAQRGDSSAYDALCARYKAFICKIARSYFIAEGGDTNDLIQEGTIGFCKAVADYRAEKNNSFPAYAALCIHNRIKDALRSALRAGSAGAPALSITDDAGEERIANAIGYEDDPVTSYIRGENNEAFFRKAEKALSARQYAVLRLYLDGFSYAEIAEELALDMKAVDNALSAAKSKLKKLYKADA